MESTAEAKPPGADQASRIIRHFEHVIVLVLMALLVLVVSLSTLELVWLLVRDVMSSRGVLLDVEQMFELFGFFLLVLIGMELLATLRSYLYERIIHVEVVLEVALVAVAQKIIVLNTARAGGSTLLGIAALVLSLAAAIWAVRSRRSSAAPEQ
ncbi:MAG: hypothetical protein K0S65_4297 [Labilithrix sp.]|nr:hypothetical protein [Labilithrix sp.]